MFFVQGFVLSGSFQGINRKNSEQLFEQRVHLFVGGLESARDVRTFEKDRIKIGSQDSNDIRIFLFESLGARLVGRQLVIVP